MRNVTACKSTHGMGASSAPVIIHAGATRTFNAAAQNVSRDPDDVEPQWMDRGDRIVIDHRLRSKRARVQ